MRRSIALLLPCSMAILGTIVGSGLAPATPMGCPSEAGGPPGAVLAEGIGVPAIVRGSIVVVRAGDDRVTLPPPVKAAGVMRHVSSMEGVGTAYVLDRQGGDMVVAVSSSGPRVFARADEARHPSLSPTGELVWAEGDGLRLAAPDGSVTAIGGPPGSTMASFPLFMGASAIITVASEAVEGVPAERDALNNLWLYSLEEGSWSRLTDFTADAEHWSVIRTPIVEADGSISFVRVAGTASATIPPSFELWNLRDGIASKVRDLPGEMYLAGADQGDRLWNVYSKADEDWRILAEDDGGSLRDLGCGRVMVDPLAEPDPDVPEARPGRGGGPSSARTDGSSRTGASLFSVYIIVGDFQTKALAEGVLRAIRADLGPGHEVRLVEHRRAPGAIAPGVWGVLVRLEPEEDPAVALERFRERFPALANASWIVAI